MEDSRRMPGALRAAGLVEIDVEAAHAERPTTMVRPANIQAGAASVFRRDGDVWDVQFEGVGARLIELKGFFDLARLLREPEVPIHCLELSGAPPAPGTPHEVLDEPARRAYRVRIEELQTDLEQAESDHDLGRTERIRAELDAVIEELTRSSGLGGRSRNLDRRVERARTATTWRIRSGDQEDRSRASPARSASRQRDPDRHLLRVRAGAPRRLGHVSREPHIVRRRLTPRGVTDERLPRGQRLDSLRSTTPIRRRREMLPNKFRLWLFDKMSVKTMRYVTAIPKGRAKGLTKSVYDMIDEDFFINGSLTSRSPVPELLAAIWTAGRETMLVDDGLDRTTKEAICAVLSDANACPYCGDMLVSLVDAGNEHDAASAIHDRDLERIEDPVLCRQLVWVRAVGTPGAEHIPPFPFSPEQVPELLGTLMSMADINRYSHVVMDGSPVDLPLGLQRPALRMFGHELKTTKVRSAKPGSALRLLPAAPLPKDLAWAVANPRIAASLAAYAATVEREAAGVVSEAVRDCVSANLAEWNHELMPFGRRWADEAVAGLVGEDRAIARFAIVLARSPSTASEDLVEPFLSGDHARFVRILGGRRSRGRGRMRGSWRGRSARPGNRRSTGDAADRRSATEVVR